MRFIKKIAVVVLGLAAFFWLLRKLDFLPSIGKLFKPKEVVIDQTPVVIKQIRSLAQLVTITAYTEVVADTTAPTSTGQRLLDVLNPFSLQVHMNRKLVVVGKVVVHAGINLDELPPGAVFVKGDSVSIQLPQAKILDAIINPSGTEIFQEEGEWDNNAVTALKADLRNKAVSEVVQRGVLYQAEEKAREVLTNFLRTAGFTKINIVKRRLG